MPRSNREFVNGTYINGSSNGPFTLFHGTGENALGTQSGGLIKVDGPSGDFQDYNQLQRRAERYNDNVTDDSSAFPLVYDKDDNLIYQRDSEGNRQAVRQGVLFRDDRKPPKAELMTVTKDARHTVPALLEIANNESQKRWGQNVQHSDNLSDHSLPLVNRLIRAGLSQGPEIKETGNDYNWQTAHDTIQSAVNDRRNYWDDSETQQISPEEFSQSGRDFVKKLSAAEKTRGLNQKGNSSPLVENPETFGLSTSRGRRKGESRLATFHQQTLPGIAVPPEDLR